jgi:hypothetical protein
VTVEECTRRPITLLQHHIKDIKRSNADDEISYLPNLLARHDFGFDLSVGGSVFCSSFVEESWELMSLTYFF